MAGGALGPVLWAAIEELLADTADADELLVARRGDDAWVAASQILAEMKAAALAIGFHALPLMLDRGLGAIEALTASDAVTKTDFAS